MQGVVSEKAAVLTPKEERPTGTPTDVTAPARPAAPPAEAERAARRMDVDEDYDDSAEEDKKPAVVTNGSGPGSAAGDTKATSPASAGVNGASAPATKTE